MYETNLSNAAIYFLTISFLFFVGSMFGWILELLFRRFFSKNNPEHKWINPGFLTGPYIPLYGFGLTALFLMSLFPYVGISSLTELTWVKTLVCILSMGLMMTVIEYIAGLIFIKGMHVKLWDYSHEWGNLQGIICPLFSLIWTVLGALYYFFIQPHIVKMVIWYFNNIAFSFVVGMFFGIFIVDFCYSMHVVRILKRFAKEHDIIIRYEELKMTIRSATDDARQRVHFIFAFKSEFPLIVQLENYSEKLKEDLTQARNELQENLESVRKSLKTKTDRRS